MGKRDKKQKAIVKFTPAENKVVYALKESMLTKEQLLEIFDLRPSELKAIRIKLYSSDLDFGLDPLTGVYTIKPGANRALGRHFYATERGDIAAREEYLRNLSPEKLREVLMENEWAHYIEES